MAISSWVAAVVYRTVTDGFAFNRELLLLYIAAGLLAASIGQGRRMLYVIRDWLPFALVLLAYDVRGSGDVDRAADAVDGRLTPTGGCSPARCRRSGCRNG